MTYRFFQLGAIFVASLLAPACSTLDLRSSDSGIAPVVVPPADEIDPAIEQRAELMFQVLAGEIAGKLGDMEAASTHYLEASKLTDDPEVAARTARIALFAKDYARAYDAVMRWVELEPNNNDALQTAGLLLVRQDRPEEAAKYFSKVINNAENGDTEVAFAQLNMLFGRDTVSESELKVLDLLRKQYPNVTHAHRTYAELAYRDKQYDLALEGVNDALKLAPDDTRALVLKNRILLSSGKVDESLASMAALIKQHPEDASIYHNYARMLVQAKRYAEALKAYDEVIKLEPDNLDLVYSKALIELELKHYDAATESLSKLTSSPHHREEAYYYLGRIAEDQGNYADAVDWYGRIQGGEYFFDAQTRIAASLAASGEFEAARTYLQSLKSQIDDAELLVRLSLAEGQLLSDHGDYQAAYDYYDKVLGDYPNNSDLLYARAMMAEKIGHIDWLERDLKAILANEPDNATALNALGYTLADRTTRYEEALDYIQRALAIRPDDAAILDSMGWVKYKMGDLDEALRYLRKAYAQLEDAEIAFHLGEVEWQMGRRDKAEAVVKRALKFSPNDDRLLQLLERFHQ
ncbi:MAG: tetratricopeptide repeat protein [Thiotrichales bacterium]